MNSAFRTIGIASVLFVTSVVFVNFRPYAFGAPVEVLLIISGIWGRFASSVYTLYGVPVWCGMVMTAFGCGELIYNIVLCVSFSLLIYRIKNRVWFFKLLSAVLVFSFNQIILCKYNLLPAVAEVLIFSALYSVLVFIESQFKKSIF